MNNFIFEVGKDHWLTRLLKINTFSVKVQPATAMDDNVHREITNILKQSPVFVYAKCPVSNVQAVAMLERNNFSLIDTNLTLQKKISRKKILLNTDNFRLAGPADEKEVIAIARKNFSFSRFHLDYAFNKRIANAIKAAWAKAYFHGGRGDAMIVAQYGGKIAGFLQLLIDQPQKNLIIDLLAIDKAMQRRGIARAMIAFAEYSFSNLDRIRVGTQIANLPSLKLYETMGFGIDSASYVLHYHN
ncbi:MAG: GNAT family N-acetyltransferase [Smithellaceae bacterium]